jgi:membrane protease YdiL (CAAX protease family)
VVAAGWIVLALAAVVYARMKSVPLWAAAPVAAAFLIEFPFYLLPGLDGPRLILGSWKKERLAGFMAASALLPWLLYTVATGEFSFSSLLILLAIAVTISFWYVLLPASGLSDAAFLALLAALVIGKVFDYLYPSPIPKVSISILGHVMLIRLAAMAVLMVRGSTDTSFRFLPNKREWLTGLRYFAMLVPVAGLAYVGLGLAELRPQPQNAAIAAGTFLGILWVVALSEEFFFRGLLQNWLANWTGNRTAALVTTSLLFGSVHLGFRFHGGFPNWRFATVAAIAGFFYGLAARSAGSIQASMVTHALTVTAWRVFLH